MWSKEATISEAKRRAAIKSRRCLVHLEEGRTIPLIADAMAALGLTTSLKPYPHPRASACRLEAPADQARRRARVVALLEEARLKMENDRRTLETY